MKATVISPNILMQSPLKDWLDAKCGKAGVTLHWRNINAPQTHFIEAFRSSSNVIAWNCRMPHHWLTQEKKNVLHIENSLLSQRAGIFVDHGGFFSNSNLCRKQTWQSNYSHANPEFIARRDFGWNAFAGGNPAGPILVALQCRNDCNLNLEFPLGIASPDKVVKTLELLKKHLPKGRPVLIRPHPSERVSFIHDGVWQDDWTLDMEGTFASRLPQCSALVTVNSTCASEAALLGVPIATLGRGAFTGSGVTLECADDPERLTMLSTYQPDIQRCKAYTSAILGRHFLPYHIQANRVCLEFEHWLEACNGGTDTPLLTPKHLGGHAGVTHVDEGALNWLRDKFGIRNMVDIGCGPGGMRELASRMNINWLGIDGDPSCSGKSVITHDFCLGPLDVPEHDLAWSVEFLEHVDAKHVAHFMKTFRQAKHVCVTHALPGKRGWHHVNCQPPDYWKKIFHTNGFDFDESGTATLRTHSTMKRGFIRDNGLLFHRRCIN